MRTEQNFEFAEDEYFLIFALGYNLLRDEIMKCNIMSYYDIFNALKKIVKLFISSDDYTDFNRTVCKSLKLFLENNMKIIKIILFNDLEYPLEEML